MQQKSMRKGFFFCLLALAANSMQGTGCKKANTTLESAEASKEKFNTLFNNLEDTLQGVCIDDSGNPRPDGPKNRKHSTGEWEDFECKNGELSGTYVGHHSTGREAIRGAFLKGKKSGKWIWRDADGKVWQDKFFQHGEEVK